MSKSSFNTQFLLDQAEYLILQENNQEYLIPMDEGYCRSDENENWLLRMGRSAPPEHTWIIPDQFTNVDEDGTFVVLDGLGNTLYLSMRKIIKVTAQELRKVLDLQYKIEHSPPLSEHDLEMVRRCF